MKRRIFTLLLCALLVAPTLLSCSGGETKDTENDTSAADSTTETTTSRVNSRKGLSPATAWNSRAAASMTPAA